MLNTVGTTVGTSHTTVSTPGGTNIFQWAAATVVEVLVEGEEERKVWEMQNPYETYLSKLDGEEEVAWPLMICVSRLLMIW